MVPEADVEGEESSEGTSEVNVESSMDDEEAEATEATDATEATEATESTEATEATEDGSS